MEVGAGGQPRLVPESGDRGAGDGKAGDKPPREAAEHRRRAHSGAEGTGRKQTRGPESCSPRRRDTCACAHTHTQRHTHRERDTQTQRHTHTENTDTQPQTHRHTLSVEVASWTGPSPLLPVSPPQFHGDAQQEGGRAARGRRGPAGQSSLAGASTQLDELRAGQGRAGLGMGWPWALAPKELAFCGLPWTVGPAWGGTAVALPSGVARPQATSCLGAPWPSAGCGRRP